MFVGSSDKEPGAEDTTVVVVAATNKGSLLVCCQFSVGCFRYEWVGTRGICIS